MAEWEIKPLELRFLVAAVPGHVLIEGGGSFVHRLSANLPFV